MLGALVHDPDARLDYWLDWSAWLGSDWLIGSTWSTPDTDIILSNALMLRRNTVVWVSGGLAGTTVPITNHIVTAAGRQEVATFGLIVRQQTGGLIAHGRVAVAV